MTSCTTFELNDSDVVCGRGGLANKHPGNRMLRRICNENKDLYQSSMNPAHKQCLILSILMAIQQHGGRFVSRNKNNEWEEICDKKAKEKVAQLLRENTDAAPIITTTIKPVQSKPVVTMDTSCNDDMMQTQPARQPILIPTMEPLPIHHTRNITPDTIPSDEDLFELFEPEPLPVPPAPSAPIIAAPPRAFDDGDLFDLIPLEAADSYGMETNPEFQSLCHGLISVLSTAAC